MSHCTKFDFTYSDQETIVRAFKKMGVEHTSTEVIAFFDNDFQKKILSKLGHMGSKQVRAICGMKDGINMFMCKMEENKWELVCEHHNVTPAIERKMTQLGLEYKQAYIEAAVDVVVKKIENSGSPTSVDKEKNKITINFGPSMEYHVAISYDEKQIKEEVYGVKGSFCTALTEDIENILSHPETELQTEYTEEMDMVVDDQVLQVISLEF